VTVKNTITKWEAASVLSVVAAVLCYFILSALMSQIGVTAPPMALHFGMPITQVVPQFSFLTGGAFVGIIVSLYIFDFFTIRQVLLVGSGLLAAAAVGNYILDSFALSPVFFAIMGIAAGIGMSAAAITITRTFDARHRASMLVGADLFYSGGGYLIVTFVAFLAASGARWSTGFLFIAAVALVLFFLTLASKFPESDTLSAQTMDSGIKEPWGTGVYLVGGAMFFYGMGQNALIVWVPAYMSATFSVGIEQAGSAVSNYWGGGTLGLAISVFVLQRMRADTFLILITSMGASLTAVLMFAQTESMFIITAGLVGLVTIPSLGSMISLGVHQQKLPSMRLVPFMLCCASSGSAISPMWSSFLVERAGLEFSMKLICSCYTATFVILSIVYVVGRIASKRKSDAYRQTVSGPRDI
jgi:TsgA-like MFS transporter